MTSLFNGSNRRVGELIHSLKAVLPEEEFMRMKEYVDYNEHGVALEHLCYVLFELETSCPTETFKAIETLGTQMGMDPGIWTKLTARG